MRTSKLSTLVLACSLTVPVVCAGTAVAQDHREQQQNALRMYDATHRDYHNWNDDEDRHDREYMQEHHRKYREFSRLSKKQQREYWQWRHDHR